VSRELLSQKICLSNYFILSTGQALSFRLIPRIQLEIFYACVECTCFLRTCFLTFLSLFLYYFSLSLCLYLSLEIIFSPPSDKRYLFERPECWYVPPRLSAMECDLIVVPTNKYSAVRLIHVVTMRPHSREREKERGWTKNNGREELSAERLPCKYIYRNIRTLFFLFASSGIWHNTHEFLLHYEISRRYKRDDTNREDKKNYIGSAISSH